MASDGPELCPSQQKALDRLMELWPCSGVFVLWSREGLGRTTVLQEVARRVPGPRILDARRFVRDLAGEPPMRMEETFLKRALALLDRCETLLIDDWDRISCPFGSCNYYYPRRGLDAAMLMGLIDAAQAKGRKLVFTTTGTITGEVHNRSLYVGWDRLTVADYAALFKAQLGKRAPRIEVQRVFDFAPRLTLLQLRGALEVLRRQDHIDTDRVVEYLQRLKMASNVNVSQVREVALEDLKGVDEVLAGLQRYVITPLAEEELARAHGVRPKRGILLYGPPGTGKTTVGRALAHRLRSKFFRIDGTFIAGSSDFHQKVGRVFEAAKDNAPSLVFIDDCDTIFEDKDEYGLYRYLLTMMDGLESEDMAGVSVMLTAMDVSSLPPALIRSGRIELWLEMKLPDLAARTAILHARTSTLDGDTRRPDLGRIAEVTEGFTGADLDRLVKDARALLIGEIAAGRTEPDLTALYLEAVQEVRRNMDVIRTATAAAQAQASLRAPNPFAFMNRFHTSGGDEGPPTA